MTSPNQTPVRPGSLLAQILTGLAQTALADGVSELVRAEGKRGTVRLNLELCLGDNGAPLWSNSSVFFEQKRHVKDARGASNDEA